MVECISRPGTGPTSARQQHLTMQLLCVEGRVSTALKGLGAVAASDAAMPAALRDTAALVPSAQQPGSLAPPNRRITSRHMGSTTTAAESRQSVVEHEQRAAAACCLSQAQAAASRMPWYPAQRPAHNACTTSQEPVLLVTNVALARIPRRPPKGVEHLPAHLRCPHRDRWLRQPAPG